jgi:hypothetical protein
MRLARAGAHLFFLSFAALVPFAFQPVVAAESWLPAARALAERLFPLDRFVAARLAFGRVAFEEDIRTSKDAALLEADHPGINAAVWEALEPEYRAKAAGDWPVFLDRAAAVYARRLSAKELGRLRDLYSASPAPSLDPLPPSTRRHFRQAQAEANALAQGSDAGTNDWRMRMSILIMTTIDQYIAEHPVAD